MLPELIKIRRQVSVYFVDLELKLIMNVKLNIHEVVFIWGNVSGEGDVVFSFWGKFKYEGDMGSDGEGRKLS